MKKQRGLTLIELVAFIVVTSIIVVGVLTAFKTVLLYSNTPGRAVTASLLADARMNLIMQQRLLNGFSSLTDPCASGSLAACTGLNSFATSNGYSVSSTISAASGGVRTATVTVTGKGNATVIARFVQ